MSNPPIPPPHPKIAPNHRKREPSPESIPKHPQPPPSIRHKFFQVSSPHSAISVPPQLLFATTPQSCDARFHRYQLNSTLLVRWERLKHLHFSHGARGCDSRDSIEWKKLFLARGWTQNSVRELARSGETGWFMEVRQGDVVERDCAASRVGWGNESVASRWFWGVVVATMLTNLGAMFGFLVEVARQWGFQGTIGNTSSFRLLTNLDLCPIRLRGGPRRL